MKKYYFLLFVIGSFFTQCIEADGTAGPPGPRGFDGIDGIDGADGEEAYVFDYELSFTAPDYSVLLNLPADFEMLESDVMLLYFLWEVQDEVEIWRPLPQTLYLEEGILAYNFDHTIFDASVFMDGTVNLDALGALYTDNWIARIVVVPGQIVNGRTSIDFSDYGQVSKFFQLPAARLDTEGYNTRP